MNPSRHRLLMVLSHPVQYVAPLLRRMAEHPRLEIMVAYASLRGGERAHDSGFGREVAWDVPVLDGYPWCTIHPATPGTATSGNSPASSAALIGSLALTLCMDRRRTMWRPMKRKKQYDGWSAVCGSRSDPAAIFQCDSFGITPAISTRSTSSIKMRHILHGRGGSDRSTPRGAA